ncbi:unnamed protein product [Owenia fusiformis]|uniref:Uncharacterized protein n=1 Tax=Owenia fusiformis TaxID=6347 RepID=A0A8J1TM15_OWEFU|nr:unnamed protein product [Owenia fusiformis]
MNHIYVAVVIAFGVVTGCFGQPSDCDNCPLLPDEEVCEFGCKVLSYCSNGTAVTVECPPHLVVDLPSKTCKPLDEAAPPCGSTFNCTGRDGRYPDLSTDCQTFYTCIDGRFDSSAVCPGGLVFDIRQQLCNWPYMVCGPCGTSTLPEHCDPITVAPEMTTETPTTVGETVTNDGNCVCANLPDGYVCEITCKEKVECQLGLSIRTRCNENLVINPETNECDLIANVCPPCGTRDC